MPRKLSYMRDINVLVIAFDSQFMRGIGKEVGLGSVELCELLRP